MKDLEIIGKQKVGDIEFTGIEGGFGENERSMLVKEIAENHGKQLKHVNLRINENRKRFIDGVDIIDLKNGPFNGLLEELGFSEREIAISNHIYILSERGYAKLAKILDDEESWKVHDRIVDGYFNMRAEIKQLTHQKPNPTLDQETKRMNAEARLKNAQLKVANLLYQIAKDKDTEPLNRRILHSKVVELVTGSNQFLPSPKLEVVGYSATEVAEMTGKSSHKMVGIIANRIGIKSPKGETNEYGYWVNTSAQNGDKPIHQWLYTDLGVEAVRQEKKIDVS